MMYMVRSSLKGLSEVIKAVRYTLTILLMNKHIFTTEILHHVSAVIQARGGHILDSLVPGEVVEVQVSVKCALNPDAGHWSSWSRPVRAVVPQSAGEFK